jgi:acetyl esterase/lipase
LGYTATLAADFDTEAVVLPGVSFMPARRAAIPTWVSVLAVVLVLGRGGPGTGQEVAARGKPASLPAVEKDIPYVVDASDEQKLDLYLPEKDGFSTIVFTYGGGWHSGSRKSVAPIGEKLQRLGFGCALLSHRLAPKDRFPAQAEDVAAAFAWVKTHVAEKGGNPRRVFLMGHSSGAQLSLLVATDPRYLARHALSTPDIAGVVGLSSPVDLEPRKDGKGFGDALMAGRGADVFSRDEAVMRAASPIRHVSKDTPPVLLVLGDRDFPMLEADAKAFVERAKGVGGSATLLIAKDRDHMGVVRSLVEDDSPTLKHVVEFVSE